MPVKGGPRSGSPAARQPPLAPPPSPPLAFDQMCIDQPPVTAATTDTAIGIPAGSWVQILADGCVQTGGSGLTWKRYVDPDPPGGSSNDFGSIVDPVAYRRPELHPRRHALLRHLADRATVKHVPAGATVRATCTGGCRTRSDARSSSA